MRIEDVKIGMKVIPHSKTAYEKNKYKRLH